VSVTSRIRTLHVTELALITSIQNPAGFLGSHGTNVPIVTVDCIEEFRKGRTQVKAKTAPMADLKDPLQLPLEGRRVPINSLIGVVT
jgi:hypothetical protein